MRLRDAFVSLEYGGDAGDQGRTLIDRRSFVDGIVSANARIERIDGALARVRDGSFGTCMGCGEEIPERRLRAQPWSEGCICCQETREMPFVRGPQLRSKGDTAMARMTSVVIPALNEAKNIEYVIALAGRASLCVGEIIVVDDGSIDETPDSFRPRRRPCGHQQSSRQDSSATSQLRAARLETHILFDLGASMEDGLREARGDVIVYLAWGSARVKRKRRDDVDLHPPRVSTTWGICFSLESNPSSLNRRGFVTVLLVSLHFQALLRTWCFRDFKAGPPPPISKIRPIRNSCSFLLKVAFHLVLDTGDVALHCLTRFSDHDRTQEAATEARHPVHIGPLNCNEVMHAADVLVLPGDHVSKLQAASEIMTREKHFGRDDVGVAEGSGSFLNDDVR
jgi:RNA polymerase-binding transcription factor DksA